MKNSTEAPEIPEILGVTNTARPPEAPETTRGVKSIFRDVRRLNRAVTRLTRLSVPVDEIHVYVLDADGKPQRELVVEDEQGTLGGALVGAVLGAIMGVVIVALAQLDAFARINDAIYGLGTVTGAFRLIAVLALIGVPVGGIVNMGHWNARKKITDAERGDGSFLVVVETEELADLARGVLDGLGGSPVPASG